MGVQSPQNEREGGIGKQGRDAMRKQEQSRLDMSLDESD